MNYLSTDIFPKIAYRKEGSGPVVVLLHGFPSDGELWKEVIPVLAISFTVIVPDLPGSGESAFIGEDIRIEQLAESVKVILDKENIDKAVIAGHSMGGYAALALADMYPDRVKGISLVHSIATADEEEKKETRRKSIALLQKEATKSIFIEQMVPNLFADGGKDLQAIVAWQIQEGMKLEARGMIGFYTAMMNRPDRTALLAKSQFPVQWIMGKKDNVIPFNKVLPQTSIANVNFVSLYADTGHMSMLEDPDHLCADITAFTNYCNNY